MTARDIDAASAPPRRGLAGWRLSRRGALAALAAVGAPGAALAAAQPARAAMPAIGASPDAELIRLCADFALCQGEVRAIYAGVKTRDDEDLAHELVKPVYARMDPIADRMAAVRAVTPAGVVARVLTLAVYAGDGVSCSFDVDDTLPGEMMRCLLRDVLSLHGLPVPASLRD